MTPELRDELAAYMRGESPITHDDSTLGQMRAHRLNGATVHHLFRTTFPDGTEVAGFNIRTKDGRSIDVTVNGKLEFSTR